MAKATKKGVSGYGKGGVDTVISVEEVSKQVSAIAQDITCLLYTSPSPRDS